MRVGAAEAAPTVEAMKMKVASFPFIFVKNMILVKLVGFVDVRELGLIRS